MQGRERDRETRRRRDRGEKFDDDDDDDDDGDDQEELNGNAQEWLSNGLFALHIRFPVICNESVTLSTVIKMEHFACVRDISLWQ